MIKSIKNVKKIIFHFNNDVSGSTTALRNKISKLNDDDYVIFTLSRGGVLDDLNIVPLLPTSFSRRLGPVINIVFFWLFSIIISLFNCDKEQVFNTLQSIPIAFVRSKFTRQYNNYKVYLHEFSVNNRYLNNFLITLLTRTNADFVFVSKYQKNYYEENYKISGSVEPNYLSPFFYNESVNKRFNSFDDRFRVTFVGSTKAYKGMQTFIQFCETNRLPDNIVPTIVSSEPVVAKESASIEILVSPSEEVLSRVYYESYFVLNLSLDAKWVETFGMTIFEACCFGAIPITPMRGGFVDFIDDTVRLEIDTNQEITAQIEQLKRLLKYHLNEERWTILHKNLIFYCQSSESLKRIVGS